MDVSVLAEEHQVDYWKHFVLFTDLVNNDAIVFPPVNIDCKVVTGQDRTGEALTSGLGRTWGALGLFGRHWGSLGGANLGKLGMGVTEPVRTGLNRSGPPERVELTRTCKVVR